MSGVRRRTVVISNQRGLHARASAKFVKTASAFPCAITVARDDQAADGKSIMDLLMLGAGIESELEITAEGDMAEAALDALTRLVAEKFGEEA